jgi:hypothetical protein
LEISIRLIVQIYSRYFNFVVHYSSRTHTRAHTHSYGLYFVRTVPRQKLYNNIIIWRRRWTSLRRTRIYIPIQVRNRLKGKSVILYYYFFFFVLLVNYYHRTYIHNNNIYFLIPSLFHIIRTYIIHVYIRTAAARRRPLLHTKFAGHTNKTRSRIGTV